MLSLFTLLLFVAINAYDVLDLNDFSADVDIYDMGMMGRGKNACIWNRSTKDKQEVFYYLAMQPWRHLVWTDCTGTECYKFFINEDASNVPKDAVNKNKMLINNDNDYCRKEYANPLPTFDIDWEQINPDDNLETADINGNTCYKYPAKEPLAFIYLDVQKTVKQNLNVIKPCRYDFIGGKSITFRSFGTFTPAFIKAQLPTGYLNNKTRCNIDPTPNNVDTDIALILGISDANIVQQINEGLSKLGDLTTVKQVKVYYLSGETIKRETVALDNLASLKTKQIVGGSIDALINTAKNELIPRINSKEIKRGTIVALMDRVLSSTFDAETAFDRNNITVHTVVYNPKGDQKMRVRARALLSVGDHYHEFTSSLGITNVINDLFIGIRTNLTERCDRNKCNGFCDARDRCTCPMCCENTCFFSYCNTTTATCMPWPEANPKKKINCTNDCVGTQECKDLEGCVYTKYNENCEPKAKCMKPYCDADNVCQQKDSCEADKKPSADNKCWSYECDQVSGNCKRKKSGNECPKLPDLCHEHVCNSKTLECTYEKKNCVKTAQYADMTCFKAECNLKTGQCENVLNCAGAVTFTGCGMEADVSNCKCDANSGFTCVCDKKMDTTTPPEGFCKEDEICDASDESKKPYCRQSNCHQDLLIDGCQIKTCNEASGQIEWVDYDCKKNVTIVADGKDDEAKKIAEEYCKDKFEIYCDSGNCLARQIDGTSLLVACGKCVFNKEYTYTDSKKWVKKYTYTYEEDCNHMVLTCPNGDAIENYKDLFVKDKNGVPQTGKCKTKNVTQADGSKKTVGECVYAEFNDDAKRKDAFEICNSCFVNMPCYKNEDLYQFTFNQVTGECGVEIVGQQPQCTVCNANKDGFTDTCKNKNITKQFNHTVGGKTFTFNYDIPKLCYPEDQCIVNHKFNCSDTTNPQIKAIYDNLLPCAKGGVIKAEYHYSQLFKSKEYDNDHPQSDDFLKEMEEKAECTWTYETADCHECVLGSNGEPSSTYLCDAVKKKYEDQYLKASVECIANECRVEIQKGQCNPKECWYYYYNETKQGQDKCEKSNIYTCAEKKKKEQEKLDSFKPIKDHPVLKDKYPEIECYHNVSCGNDQETCGYVEKSTPCEKAYDDYMNGDADFGCRIPNPTCDFNTLHCTFTEMTHVLNDTRFFQERDEVVFGDKCYNYTCHEFFNTTSNKLEHHWVLTPESVNQLNKKPDTICDTVHCDPEKGESVSERRTCNPIEDYGLSERMAQCFQCACSLQTGENVLTMRPNTEKETYELDACGNCVVRDRATGNQINEVVECVLAQPVNLTGAIAGATVAASVVFGLIGSMVVVSIGALQTYQLVSSAMKNVISTTLENPEFVAADNEATNVLNNGD